MTAEFDYDQDGTPDLNTIRSIAAEMANAGKPPAMTDTERAEWQAWREQQEWLAEHQRRESERQREISERAEKAEAERLAAIARAERSRQLREDMDRRNANSMRDAQLGAIHQASIRNEQFRNAVVKSQVQANARARLKAVLFPPEPQAIPEPTVVYVEPEEDTFCGVKVPRWR